MAVLSVLFFFVLFCFFLNFILAAGWTALLKPDKRERVL